MPLLIVVPEVAGGTGRWVRGLAASGVMVAIGAGSLKRHGMYGTELLPSFPWWQPGNLLGSLEGIVWKNF